MVWIFIKRKVKKMKEEIINKLSELFEVPDFEEKLSLCEDETQILDLFSANGLEITEEELHEIMAYATKANEGEIGEDQLEDVSGGAGIFRKAAVVVAGIRNLIPRPLLPRVRK